MFDFLKLKKNFKLFQKKDPNKKKSKENENKINKNCRSSDSSGPKCSYDDSVDSPDLEQNSLLDSFVESPEIPKHCGDLKDSSLDYVEYALEKLNKSANEIYNQDRSLNEKIDILNDSKDSQKLADLNISISNSEKRKSFNFKSVCSISSPIYMDKNNFSKIDFDNPVYLSKFPNAHVDDFADLTGHKYENMIFDSAFNDYVSIIRGKKFKNSIEDNLDLLDRLIEIYHNELSYLFDDLTTSSISKEVIDKKEKLRNFDNDNPVFLSKFANGYPSQNEEILSESFNLGKFKYRNLIFESEYNDYVSFIKQENNRIKKYKRSSSFIELFDVDHFLDPWKSSRSRDARSEPRVPTRYLFPFNASASRLCRPKCKSLGNLEIFKKQISISRNLAQNQNESKVSEKNEPKALQRSLTETFLKPGYGQSGKINKPKMEPFFVSLGPITQNSSIIKQDLLNLVDNSDLTKDSRQIYKIYPYEMLSSSRTQNLPHDVDRHNVERHLSETEFQQIFDMSLNEFYKLPEWKQMELKKIVRLF